VPIDFVRNLDSSTFVPRGGTALLDAVGKTILNVGKQLLNLKEQDRPDKVIVVILTDGEENSSVEFTYSKIKEMVEHQSNSYKWVFTYIGANQDAWNVGAQLGISANNNLSYVSNAKGTKNAFDSLNTATTCCRSLSVADFGYTSADIENQVDAGLVFNNALNVKGVFNKTMVNIPANNTTTVNTP
jgi:hypothetical protein